MSGENSGDLSGFSMLELFRAEAETQMGILSRGLVELEAQPGSKELLKELMRAAHSMKGAARIVNYDVAVRIAHAMEDCLVAAQSGELDLASAHIDALLHGVDLIMAIASVPESDLPAWEEQNSSTVEECIAALAAPASEIPMPPQIAPSAVQSSVELSAAPVESVQGLSPKPNWKCSL